MTVSISSLALVSNSSLSVPGKDNLAFFPGLNIQDFRGFAIGSFLLVASLFAFPEWTEGTVLAVREVFPFLVRAAHVSLAHRHGLDAVLEEKILQLLLHFRVGRHARSYPALHDCLSTVMEDHACGYLRGCLVIGAVHRHGANRVLRLPM